MNLRDRFAEGLKEALKAKDQRRVSTLRLILAALKDRDIAARTEDRCGGIADEEIIELLRKMARQRDEAIEMYDGACRADLAEKEREEKAIIEAYLPAQMSAEETEAAVRATLEDLGAGSLKDMGRVMAELKSRHAGVMDFSRASALVRGALAGAPKAAAAGA